MVAGASRSSSAATIVADVTADGRPGRERLGVAARAALLATCHSPQRTSSRASFIQLTTWKGSMTHLAFGHRRFTSVLIHLAPSAVTTSTPRRCSRVSSSRNRVSAAATTPGEPTVMLTYWRNQEQHDRLGRDPGDVGIINARSREVGELLSGLGFAVTFAYPDGGAVRRG